jgi:CheY-like chemotaxis protein
MNTKEHELRPRPGGTHAVIIAAGSKDVRSLLLDTFTLGLGREDRYRVHEEETEDGAVALALISRPSVIVLDQALRSGDGLAACRRLKADRTTRDCAVFIVSGDATAEERARAWAAGADAFLPKPFSPKHLYELASQASRTRTQASDEDGDGRVARAG